MGLKHTAEPMEEEPQTKKLRTEDSLIPEQQFLARNKVFFPFNASARETVPTDISNSSYIL